MITIDRERFFVNLRTTQTYCEQQLLNKDKFAGITLRSFLNPIYEGGKWFVHPPACEQPILWSDWEKDSDPYNVEFFVSLFAEQLNYKQNLVGDIRQQEVYRGKILVVEHGMNIPDGVVEEETGGFFDGFDLPPIDTWFYNDYSKETRGILFAWIPEQFIDLVDKAIATQFLDIIHWFEKPPKWPLR